MKLTRIPQIKFKLKLKENNGDLSLESTFNVKDEFKKQLQKEVYKNFVLNDIEVDVVKNEVFITLYGIPKP